MKTPSRSINILAFTLPVFITLTMPVHAQSPVEIIVNGGFETGDLTGWNGPVPNPNPWSVSTVQSHIGNHSAYNPALDTALAGTTMSQTFSATPVSGITTAGYWYYHPAGAPGTVGLAALLLFSDGTDAQDRLLANDLNYQVNVWTYRDLRPILSMYSDKQLIGIGFFPKGSGNQFIDDVSIVGIPEPSTAILGCLGILSMVCVFCGKHSMRRGWPKIVVELYR